MTIRAVLSAFAVLVAINATPLIASDEELAPEVPHEAPDAQGCGIDASIIAIRRLTRLHPTWQEVAKLADADEDGYSSLVDLRVTLAAYGLAASIRRTRDGVLPSTPCILHLTPKESVPGAQHLVYCEPRANDDVVWFRPPHGWGRSRGEAIARDWTGYYVQIGSRDLDLLRSALWLIVGVMAGLGVGMLATDREYSVTHRTKVEDPPSPARSAGK